MIVHEGVIEGYNAIMGYLPERKVTIIILSNVNTSSLRKMFNKLLDVMGKRKQLMPDSGTRMGRLLPTNASLARQRSELLQIGCGTQTAATMTISGLIGTGKALRLSRDPLSRNREHLCGIEQRYSVGDQNPGPPDLLFLVL